MPISHNQTVHIKPVFFYLAAASLLLFPLSWVFAWFIAVTTHELSHYIMLKLCRIPVYCIHIGISGAQIETGPISDGKQVLCALAGPLGGLSLCLLSRYFPKLALCALIQSVFNLLPIYPFDGGKVIAGFLIFIAGQERGERWIKRVEVLVLAILIGFCISCTLLLHLGPIPLLFALLLFIRWRKIKLPCKVHKQIVQ